MLCELAHSFPPRIAELLERDRNLSRNFREETVTDLLMASMVGLEAFGVQVVFPDEPTTGGDMEWIYAAPLEANGGRYLRLMLQAKRAKYVDRKRGGYWFYEHLDHGAPPGSQAQTLVGYAASASGAMATLPLYIFYHPTSATVPASIRLPAVQGINLVFADLVAPVVTGRCPPREKKVDRWRSHFLPLSDLLCWPVSTIAPAPPQHPATQFIVEDAEMGMPLLASGFHPDIVASRFNERRDRAKPQPQRPLHKTSKARERQSIEPAEGIPEDILRAIDGKTTLQDRRKLKRPRVVLATHLSRDSPDFPATAALSSRPRN